MFDATPKRFQRDPALEEPTPLTPIAAIVALRADKERGDEVLFTVATDEPTTGYVAIAELDSYDGDTWRFDRTFSPTGGRIPRDDAHAGEAGVTQRYTIRDLAGLPWMPHMPSVQRVHGLDVRFDQATGMVMPSAALGESDRYTVESSVVPESLAAHDFSVTPTPGGFSGNSRDTLLPVAGANQLRDALETLSHDVSPAATEDPVGYLRALTAKLRGYTRTNTSTDGSEARVEAGTSLADVLSTVVAQREGTPEQYATLLVLAARRIGVPARLNTGFRIAGGGAALAPGRYDVTAGDAWTWAEIATVDGWVVADPTPSAGNTTPTTTPGAAAPDATTTVPTNPLLDNPEGGRVAPAPTVPPSGQSQDHSLTEPLPYVALAAVAVAAAFPLSYRVRRASRRRRRRSGTPSARVVGAWHETIETMREEAIAGLDAMTSSEAATEARIRFGPRAASHAAVVGQRAELAIFAPSIATTDAEAQDAWQQVGSFRAAVRAARSRRDSLRSLLRTRSPVRVSD
jgi:transglutaminase-like putative cysteine protease